jgi:hypothetical protein
MEISRMETMRDGRPGIGQRGVNVNVKMNVRASFGLAEKRDSDDAK